MIRIAIVLLLVACGGGEPPVAAPPVAEVSEMCAEHGVLEALCTKCNPSIANVFKQKGDWCEAHGFPESICPICHPERGGRPAIELTPTDESPPDGIQVRLASTIVAPAIGVQTAVVEVAAPELEVVAQAKIVYDAARHARINPRLPGVVATVDADIGTRVSRGTVLATIASGELGDRRARVGGAKTRVELARLAVSRQQNLAKDGVASQRQLEEARRELADARAELAALEAQVKIVDTGDSETYRLVAPIDGVVIRRTASIGAFVESSEVLFEVVDTSLMWAELDIPEADLALVAQGQHVALRVDGVDTAFEGELAFLSPEVDPHSRTVKGRVALANADQRLRANQWGRAAIRVPREPTPLLVPRAAVQSAKDVSLVFVTLRADLYEGRRVKVGRAWGDKVEVVGRLAVGDEVVTDGAFLLKTETLKDAIGAGCCDHGAGTR